LSAFSFISTGKAWFMFEGDRRMCERCGAWIRTLHLTADRHTCRLDTLVEFQARLAREALEDELDARVAEWEQEPRLARRLAFARYLRERNDKRRDAPRATPLSA
jgi:hypothetical protein